MRTQTTICAVPACTRVLNWCGVVMLCGVVSISSLDIAVAANLALQFHFPGPINKLNVSGDFDISFVVFSQACVCCLPYSLF